MESNIDATIRLAHGYFFAKKYIISRGYACEIDWQDNIDFNKLTKEKFLEEMSWVILASGMSDKVIRKIFPKIRQALLNFQSVGSIVDTKDDCILSMLKVFKHRRKIEAIIHVAQYLNKNSIYHIQCRIKNEGIAFIKSFPFMGNATAFHFAKNIGFNVAKPDRHLLRIADALGYATPASLCEEIAEIIQEKVSLIDLVIWRYATLDKNYLANIDRFFSDNKKSGNSKNSVLQF